MVSPVVWITFLFDVYLLVEWGDRSLTNEVEQENEWVLQPLDTRKWKGRCRAIVESLNEKGDIKSDGLIKRAIYEHLKVFACVHKETGELKIRKMYWINAVMRSKEAQVQPNGNRRQRRKDWLELGGLTRMHDKTFFVIPMAILKKNSNEEWYYAKTIIRRP